MDWQPIESAPDEPVLVLAFGDTPCWGKKVVYPNGEVYWLDYNDEYNLWPTHWMPLPRPPRTLADSDGDDGA